MSINSFSTAVHGDSDSVKETERLIHQLAALLPSQGPITAFAFQNPLEGLEEQPFFDVLRKVNYVFGCEPFLQEGVYRKKFTDGRITVSELKEIIGEDLQPDSESRIAGLIQCGELRLSMLTHSINPGTENELRWELGGIEAIRRFRTDMSHGDRENLVDSTRAWVSSDFHRTPGRSLCTSREELSATVRKSISRFHLGNPAALPESAWESICLSLLWKVSRSRIKSTPRYPGKSVAYLRPRDLLLAASNVDSDELVHPVLGRFCSAYLDQGYAHWRLPRREQGLFRSFLSLFSTGGHFTSHWLRSLGKEVRRIQQAGMTAIESLEESLVILGILPQNKEAFLTRSLLALRGWAGMVWQTETRPDRVYVPSPKGSLVDYLAARLLLDRFAILWIAENSLNYRESLDQLVNYLATHFSTSRVGESVEHRAYPILQLAQLHGWTPQQLAELSNSSWVELVREIESFSPFERRRVFHLAFERRLAHQALDAIAARAALPLSRPDTPRLQVFTCIDAREESFRRHIEEVAPDVETFGNAGFFNVPMYFRGAGEAHFTALCPIVVKPKNWVVEDVVLSLIDSDRQRANARRWLGAATHQFNTGTRGSVSGALLTAVLGPLFTAPLVGRIIFPRLTAKMYRTARGWMATPPVTRLRLERSEGTPSGPNDEGIGFTLTEMIAMGERALRDTGLTSNFARLVIILGHGSNCLNNPHESAYHCGACSGAPGAANARALAAILNDRRVRAQLLSRGIAIPDETHFLGGLHNTATESIRYYDLELLPTSHVRDIKAAMEIFSRVAERNAHERCRRFETASLQFTPMEALQHVEDRSEDLAQTRPEYGNSTNAMCFVGRRSRVRGMFLDRRSFMMSYDASQDNVDSMILARILAAVIPVCEGINMLYTLSAIDNSGWGSGTKLPHNITSLLGVMDGAASDLRTGLPWQGVDIHEPVRLLFIIETTAAVMLKIINENPTIARICRNGWVQLAVLDPNSDRIQQFCNGTFIDYEPLTTELPQTPSSVDWYRGRRENLNFAMVVQEKC